MKYKDHQKEISGAENLTTNNRMEIMACIEALKLLKEPCCITLFSDSQYVCNSISKGWAKKWKENDWKKNKKEIALNHDLWDTLLNLLEIHKIEVKWIKGHSGHPENERCDQLAVLATQKLLKN